jgi:hypothetical protein
MAPWQSKSIVPDIHSPYFIVWFNIEAIYFASKDMASLIFPATTCKDNEDVKNFRQR